MNDPEIILKKKLLNQTIDDCKLIDKHYQKLKSLWSELDDHDCQMVMVMTCSDYGVTYVNRNDADHDGLTIP